MAGLRNISVGISFFLVQIEVYKIDASLPAPKFNIICEPNDWGKTVKKSEGGDAVSALKLQQQEFWEVMKEYASSVIIRESGTTQVGELPVPIKRTFPSVPGTLRAK